MLTRDDFIDIVMEKLGGLPAATPAARGLDLSREPKGRLFLSEYDIRKKLTKNPSELRIPGDAIVSPLAVDWLILQRVNIVRERA